MPKGMGDALALSSNVLPTQPVAGESVDKGFNSATETFNIDKGDHTVDHAKASQVKSCAYVEVNVPRKLITVHRRLVNRITRIISALNLCSSKEQFSIEYREVTEMKKEYAKFRKVVCDLNDTDLLNQLSQQNVDKYETSMTLTETLKLRNGDSSKNDLSYEAGSDNDDLEPTDSVFCFTAGQINVSSRKSCEVRRIELDRRRSELQVLEELAKSRRHRAEADAESRRAEAEAETLRHKAEAMADAEAAEAETLAKLRLETINLEAQKKLEECSERGSSVSKRSKKRLGFSKNYGYDFCDSRLGEIDPKLRLSLNADKVKLNVDPFVKSTVEDMTVTKKMTKLQPDPVLNVAMPLETKPAVTNHLNDVFAVGSSAGLNPKACGFAPQRASAVEGCQRTAVACNNDEYLRELDPVLRSRSDSLSCSRENWNVPSREPVDNPDPYHYARNANTVLHTYLERQGRNEYINLASQWDMMAQTLRLSFMNIKCVV